MYYISSPLSHCFHCILWLVFLHYRPTSVLSIINWICRNFIFARKSAGRIQLGNVKKFYQTLYGKNQVGLIKIQYLCLIFIFSIYFLIIWNKLHPYMITSHIFSKHVLRNIKIIRLGSSVAVACDAFVSSGLLPYYVSTGPSSGEMRGSEGPSNGLALSSNEFSACSQLRYARHERSCRCRQHQRWWGPPSACAPLGWWTPSCCCSWKSRPALSLSLVLQALLRSFSSGTAMQL